MPTFEVDDQFHSHPKTIEAGDDALGLWVRVGSWCMAYLTDGRVPRGQALKLGHPSQWDSLVRCELVTINEDGSYQMHDWLHWQRPATWWHQYRAKDAEKKRNLRASARALSKCGKVTPRGCPQGTPSVTPKENPIAPLPLPLPLPDPDQSKVKLGTSRAPNGVETVFAYWAEKLSPKAKLDSKRRAIIERALKLYSVGDLKRVVDGTLNNPHRMGSNDQGKRYVDIALLYRDADHIDAAIDLADGPRDLSHLSDGHKIPAYVNTDPPGTEYFVPSKEDLEALIATATGGSHA